MIPDLRFENVTLRFVWSSTNDIVVFFFFFPAGRFFDASESEAFDAQV